jgi:hypothetical protein
VIGAIGGRAKDLAYQEPNALGFILLGATLAIGIWAIADAARRPAAAWQSLGRNRTLWVALLVVATVFARLLGLPLAIYYLAFMRPKLQRAATAEPSDQPDAQTGM